MRYYVTYFAAMSGIKRSNLLIYMMLYLNVPFSDLMDLT